MLLVSDKRQNETHSDEVLMLLSRKRQEEDTGVGKPVSLCRLFDAQCGCVIFCICVCVYVLLWLICIAM